MRGDETSVGCCSQLSPSQLPALVSATLEDVGENGKSPLDSHVVSGLQRLLCCPLCHRALLGDPTVVDVCGHVFCYDCINLGLEYGCYPVATATMAVARGGSENVAETVLGNMGDENASQKGCKSAGGQRQRKRKVKLTCPVCLVPAHKWNLVRVPLFREIVLDLMSHPTLAEALGGCDGVS